MAGASVPPSPPPPPPPPATKAPEGTVRLVDLLGTRTETEAVIILTFSGPFAIGPIHTDLEAIRLRIPRAATALAAFREYRTFESWLRLAADGDDLEIAIGRPARYDEPLFEILPNPPRLRIAFSPA